MPGGASAFQPLLPFADVIVPTLGRPAALTPLLESLATSVGPGVARITFVLDDADTESAIAVARAWEAGHEFGTLFQDGTFPTKTNAGVEATAAEWVLLAADDVVFRPGWLEAALEAEMASAAHVIGTNDLTPATAAGDHATMPLVRRSYIEQPGAAFDLPGAAFCEGYHHNFCETELCHLAMHRGVFVFAPESIVEHRHPSWGTREPDDTDRKGNLANVKGDEWLFLDRQARWLA